MMPYSYHASVHAQPYDCTLRMLLSSRAKHDADRAPCLHGFAGTLQFPVILVHPEGDNRVALFIRNEEEALVGVYGEETRGPAVAFLPVGRGHAAAIRINSEDGDAVMPAI